MKSSLQTSTPSLGLQPLDWLVFQQAATSSYVNLSASVALSNVIPVVVTQQGNNNLGGFTYQIFVPTPMPAWMRAGVSIKLDLSVADVKGNNKDISGYYIVKSVSVSGTANQNYITINGPSPLGGRNADALTQATSYTINSASGGTVSSPAITLVIQCQRVAFTAISGTVIITPGVDGGGTAIYPITLVNGQSPLEWEIIMQPGDKFDLADWLVKTSSSGTLGARFI